jgi:hypothetical protein
MRMTPRDRVRKLVPRSSRVQATLLALAGVLAFLVFFALGRATAPASAMLRTAPPLVTRSQAVEISGLPAARALPTLRPQPVRRKPPARTPPARHAEQPSPAPAHAATPPPPPPPSPSPRPSRRKPVVIVGEG